MQKSTAQRLKDLEANNEALQQGINQSFKVIQDSLQAQHQKSLDSIQTMLESGLSAKQKVIDSLGRIVLENQIQGQFYDSNIEWSTGIFSLIVVLVAGASYFGIRLEMKLRNQKLRDSLSGTIKTTKTNLTEIINSQEGKVSQAILSTKNLKWDVYRILYHLYIDTNKDTSFYWLTKWMLLHNELIDLGHERQYFTNPLQKFVKIFAIKRNDYLKDGDFSARTKKETIMELEELKKYPDYEKETKEAIQTVLEHMVSLKTDDKNEE